MKPFESFLAGQLEEYVSFAAKSGRSAKQTRRGLRSFDLWLSRRDASTESLTPRFLLRFAASAGKSPNTANHALSAVRMFFQYLLRREIVAENPLRDIPLFKKRYFVPFIFGPEQVELLLKAVAGGIDRSPKRFPAGLAAHAAITLMARCGMRIGEPLRLLRSDFRADEGTVYIEKTKFRKDRLIPVPKSALAQLGNYLAARRALIENDDNPFLLAASADLPLKDRHVRRAFQRAVEEIGEAVPARTFGDTVFGRPTPHSLRHSFAANTLRRARDNGINPQRVLPVLAVYMGHCRYEYTAAYLKVLDRDRRAGLIAFAKSQGRSGGK